MEIHHQGKYNSAVDSSERVPGRRVTFVKALMAEIAFTNCPVVFEPDHCWTKDSVLLIEESGLKADD